MNIWSEDMVQGIGEKDGEVCKVCECQGCFKLNEPHMHYQELLASVQPDLVSRSGNYTGARLLSLSLQYASALVHIIGWQRQEAATHTSLIKQLAVFLRLICLSFYNANEACGHFCPCIKWRYGLVLFPMLFQITVPTVIINILHVHIYFMNHHLCNKMHSFIFFISSHTVNSAHVTPPRVLEKSQSHREDHNEQETCFKLKKAKNIYHVMEDELKRAELSEVFSGVV